MEFHQEFTGTRVPLEYQINNGIVGQIQREVIAKGEIEYMKHTPLPNSVDNLADAAEIMWLKTLEKMSSQTNTSNVEQKPPKYEDNCS